MKRKWTSMMRIIPTILLMLLCMHSAWGQQKGTGTPTVQGIWSTEFTETLKSDASGCYWEVTFNWACAQNNTTQFNLWTLPHGIRITVSGSTIVGSPTLSIAGGSWTNTFSTISGTSVQWTNTPTLPNTPYSCPGTPLLSSSVIPYLPAVVTIKVYVSLTSGSQSITVESLLYSGGNQFQPSSTDTKPPISAPPPRPAIPDNPSICKGKATWVRLIPPVNPPAKIKWYKYSVPGATCNQPCPPPPTTIPPGSPWVEMNSNPPQPGVNNVPTNPLFQTTCYVAVIDSGCFRYLSTVARVEVCEPLTGINISPTVGSQPLQNIDGKNRACNTWTGGLALNYTQCCPTTVSWTRSIDNGSPVAVSTVSNLTLTAPTDLTKCFRKYTYTATVSNACTAPGTPPVSTSFTIFIDRIITPSDITLTGNVWDLTPNLPSPLGPICYEQSARIQTRKRCNEIEIVEWQEMKWTPTGNPSGSWVTIPGALGTPLYHTNKLENPGPGIKSIWHRVKIKNGACPPVWSAPYEIRVKPELTVSLSPLVGRLCPPTPSTITLTATPSYTLGVTYQWYLNGALIPGIGPTKIVNQPGYYYVVVSDAACSKTAKSDVSKICSDPIVFIEGPCVVCKGEVFNLTALVFSEPEDCTSDCVTYLWTASNGGNIISPPNTKTITANQPGRYDVEVKCGTCKRKARIEVRLCPPIK